MSLHPAILVAALTIVLATAPSPILAVEPTEPILEPIGLPSSEPVEPRSDELLQPRARVEHHLREVRQLVQHFETLAAQGCPRFTTPQDWNAYVETELDRVALLVAHVQEARAEAKRANDIQLRRAVRSPRLPRGEAETLLEKLVTCAADNGSTFAPLWALRRVEREVPRRRLRIALPD